MDTGDPRSVYAAQGVLDAYAEEVRQAAGVTRSTPPPTNGVPGWCEVGIDGHHDGVTVWWKGPPPPAVLAVLDRAKANGVTPKIINTAYDHESLQPTVDALVKHMDGKLITRLSVATDCSGVQVGLLTMTAANQAQVRGWTDGSAPLLFEQANQAVPL